MGKLSNSVNQKNATYTLPLEEHPNVEHGFVENLCRLFDLQERLRKMRLEIEENGYTSKYTSLMGNQYYGVQ